MDNVIGFLVAATIGAILGLCFFVGVGKGADMACQSVGLEWVKDKCMKVTREEAQ